MGKRSRSKARKDVLVEESASENSSKQTSPVPSDSEEEAPPPKKTKTENGGKRTPKSSADICEKHGLTDVELEYTVADYQNLTNYGLFVRMVRPQVAAANPKITSSRMVQIMEAKWREFKESNPLVKKKPEQEQAKKAESEKKSSSKKKKDKKHKESHKKERKHERKSSKKSRKVQSSEEEEEEEKDDDATEEEEEEEEVEEEPTPPKRPSIGLKIKLPLNTPKSSSAKKSKKDRRSGSSRRRIDDSDEEESRSSSKRSSRVATPISRQSDSRRIDDSDEEESRSSSKRSSRVATPIYRQSDSNAEATSPEEEADSEDETPSRRGRTQPKRRSKSGRKVVQQDPSTEEEDEEEEEEEEDAGSDDDFTTPKPRSSKSKSRQRKPKEPEDKDFETDEEDQEEEEEDEEDDEDMDTDEERSKRKKRKSEPPVIPGERKSERKRKTLSDQLLSDKEFEKILKEEALEKRRKKDRERRAKKRQQKDKFKVKGKKGYWQQEEEEEEKEKEGSAKEDIDESDDHYWYCEACKDGGDLLLCDTCPKSWHKDCAKIEGEIPDGDWSCPKCKGTYESEEEDHHDLYCKECKDGGDVLLCDFCKFVYHPKCTNPPLLEIPDGEWKCPRCVIAGQELKAKMKRVLFWRWSHQLSGTDELDHTQSPQKKAAAQAAEVEQKEKEAQGATPVKRPERLFFCKFEYHSFWDCEWLTELQLEVHCPLQYAILKRKWDLDEAPALEDGSSWGRQRRKTRDEEDPHNLEERYYRYGVKPAWLQIHRIITHDSGKEGGKNTRYLVKWRDLGYEDCTWELPSMLPAGLEDWDKYYKAYWDHRKKRMKPPVEKKKKKSDLKKKWEKQPDYIDSTGGKLHPYQLEGVNWMRFSWAQDTNIILADEMGLGKTIQAITILYTLWREGYCKGPFLISAPLSTVPNWEREFEFWAPDMYVLTYAGHKEARAVIREHEFTYEDDAFHQLAKAGKMRSGARPKFDVLLTSYEMVNVDSTTLQSITWEILVVDEAHRLKSQASLFFQTLSKYKINFKLLLTGTPLQNNLEELFNLLNFLEPKTFTDMDNFLDEFSDINKDEQVRKLHEMLAPHMLRRLKLDVLTDLPTKSEFIVRIELAPMQKKFYKHILTKNYEALNVKGYANSTSLINIMMDLRKCCNHPYLFPAAEKEAPLTMNGLYEGNGLIKACGKLELLTKMLKELKKQNHRVLIFSQMTRALDILEDFLTHEGYGYERIDGSITGKLRQESIDRFNDKESSSFVFLLSTKAGGLGINLATADTVIIYDMDWNPHNDIQALSRAHRIGQQNRVLIYRFVSRNTVEERITEVAKKKMMLTELVIHRGMGSEKQESLSKKEVSDILKFGAEDLFKDTEEGNVVWTDEAVNKLLDRNQESETPETTEKEAVMGMNEYLRSFKVASYHVKEGEEEAEKEEEEEEEKEEERKEEEPDEDYWRRVLGKTYQEHRAQIMQQEEAVARSLGKGKRVRRQVNYAEVIHTSNSNREAAEKEALAKAKGKRPTEEAEDEPEDMVEEETKYMSDYEPDEEESSEEEEEEEPEEEGPPSDNQDDEWVGPKKPQEKKEPPTKKPTTEKVKTEKAKTEKGGRPSKALKPVSTELPPLLAKVNGHTEVLGFTARQRRAFLDAVMRYGMPPEDGHQSQWLVRDLRNKVERVFRAYVSLFMRHLCEPVSDDAEKFSDGVPREGLSRQHVLTRIGIIALIRRKVQEFEENNGTDSMSAFRRKTAKTNTIVIDASQLKTPEKTEQKEAETGKEDKDKEVKVENGKQEEEKKDVKDEKDKKEEVKEEVKEEKTGKDEKVKDEVKEEEDKEKGESEKEKKKEKDEGKEEKDSGEDDKEEEDEKMEVDDDDEEEDEDSEEEEMRKEEEEEAKKTDIPQVDGAGDDKESSSEKDKSEEKEEEAAKGEEKKKEKQKEEKEMKTDEKEGEKVKEKKDSEDEPEEKEEKKEKEEAKSDKKKTEEKEGKDSDIEDLGSDQEEVPEKGKTKATEEKGEGSKEKTKGEESAKGEEKKNTEEKEKAEEKKSSEGKKDDSAKSTTPSKSDEKSEKSEKEKEKMKIVVDLRKQAWELRRIFYIADGGFTELHALWQYEEQQLKPGREYETWHRRHDYWLLAGIITHGYRHWQDILNDPRFGMLNRAFQSDAEKMRKAAFLNRRFQLLEQALVIEEQLHKAVLQSADLRATLRKNCRGDIDAYAELDQLAILLRQIARRGATQDAHLARVLAQLESLVGDIKHSTNSVVPATLARAPGVVIRQSGQHGPSPVGRPRVNPGGMRPVQQVVIPRHLMDQRRNTPSPNSKTSELCNEWKVVTPESEDPTVITLE